MLALTKISQAIYLSINDAGNYPGYAVTIVTASEADGDTLGSQQVPEPTSVFSLVAFGALGVGSMLKRKQQQKSVSFSATQGIEEMN